MSVQTTIAAAVDQAAAADLRDHNTTCLQCRAAKQFRRPAGRCADGMELSNLAAAARRALEAEKAADKAPNPRQGALW